MKLTDALEIRPAHVSDFETLSEICYRCVSPNPEEVFSQPTLPGKIWVDPYPILEPDLAFVLVKSDRVIGYCVATADSRGFYQRQKKEWFPKVRPQMSSIEAKTKGDAAVLSSIDHPKPIEDALVEKFPAHLHINLLAEARGGGSGSTLLLTQLDALRKAGASGVHIGLNPAFPGSARFYKRHGFQVLHPSEPYLMGRFLS